MAHFSVHVGTVRRRIGQNAIATAAYISRSKLALTVTDKETNISVDLVWDYSKKSGLAYSKIYAPEHAPDWVFDRQVLWNKAEQVENRSNSETAGKIMIALPNKFSEEQNIALLKDIVSELVSLGMVVDANIHNDHENNPHLHIQHTQRELVKNRYEEIEFSPIKNVNWRGPQWVNFVREMAAEKINTHYFANGFDLTVTQKSYKELGIDLEPGVHEGPARNIKNAELVELNRQIAAGNAEKIKAKPSIILDVLAMNSPVFTREQIAAELDKRLYAGIDFTKVENIEQVQNELSTTFLGLYEQILTCPEISLVIEEDLKGRTLYTTTKRLELEERYINNVEALYKSNRHTLNLKDSDLDHQSMLEILATKTRDIATASITKINEHTGLRLDLPRQQLELSEEQRKAVLNILNGADISVLEGIPGAGKTTAMRELVRQYQKAGRVVIGVAPSSSASLELAKATGIECKNASLWRKKWMEASGKEFELMLRGDYYKEKAYQGNNVGLTKNHVMIIDEASMGELANMDYLINQARIVGAKVIKVGDMNQLSPVGWAGALAKAIGICGSEKLEESRRQINPLHQEATKLLGSYKVRSALDIFWQEGAIKVSKTCAEAHNECINEFVLNYVTQSKHLERDDLVSRRTIAIGVFENNTRQLYNTKVREKLKEVGVIKGAEYKFHVGSLNGQKQFLSLARGEQIVFARNANTLGNKGIFNGELATILKVKAPNQDGHGVVSVLVHKASGKKEKVALDFRELAQSKWFNDGISIDYGYALTAHKLQGATIDHMLVAIEKGIGFELFNVLATRHRHGVSFHTSKELLESIFYEAVEESSEKGKNRFNIHEESEEVIVQSGLAKLVSKRINTSFAVDYRTMGQKGEDKVIKDYLDRSEDTIVVIRKLTTWQTQEQRKSGLRPEMWQNKELWQEFRMARDSRARLAVTIKNDYEAFKDRLLQLNMNYATIEKHASQVHSKTQLDKVIVEQKATILHEQEIFKNLVQSVAAGATISVRKSLSELNSHIAETLVAIEEKNSLITVKDEQRQELIDAIREEKHFRSIFIPEYLSRIYKPTDEGKEAGIEVLEKYQELVAKYGAKQATNMVVAKPTILGELNGWGIGSLMAFTHNRKDATELLKNISRQLNAFNESQDMERVFNEKLEQGNFGERIFALEEEIEHLRSLLPADIDKEFVNSVEEKLKTASNNIDWRELQHSKLFDAVRVGMISKAQHESLTEHSIEEKETKAAKATKIASELEQKQDRQIRSGQKEASLTFVQVKEGLNQFIVSEIFREYAPHLNPDGKIQKRGNQISSGSLNMDLGNKLGLWKRFSDGSKGDIFSFVEKATGCSKLESLEIVASHAGISPNSRVSNFNYYQLKQDAVPHENKNQGPKNEWVAHDVVPVEATAFDAKTDLTFLSKNGSKIVEQYEYKNKDNQLLGYTLRIQDQDGNKQVLPVTYCYNQSLEQSKWMFKGFTDKGNKPIYGHNRLVEKEYRPVLIVEGERTANIAQHLLPDHVVISWMGGAQSVDRVNWASLAGRVVTIWPDNDKPGMESAKNIAEHIDNHNGFSGLVSIVDTKALNLSEKWDLADELPRHLSVEQLPSIIDNASSSQRHQVHSELQQTQQSDGIIKSIDMLVATNRMDKDDYSSKELYHATMVGIAKLKNIDLAKSDNVIEDLHKIQDEYRARQKSYALQAYANSDITGATINDSANSKEQLVQDLVRHTVVLHEIEYNVKKLTKTHIDHIEQTAKEKVGELKRFADSDKEYAAHQMYKAVTSSKWRDQLEEKNEQKSAAIKLHCKEGQIEAHYVNSTLANITQEKQEAKTPAQIINVIKKEQEFLVNLNGNLKYPERCNKQLTLAIQSAIKNEREDAVGQLGKISSFVQNKNIKTGDQVTKILRQATDPMTAHKTLLNAYQDHFLKRVQKGLNMIEKHDSVTLDNHKFECPIKFLDHIVKTYASDYMPHHEIKRMQNQAIEYMKHMEMSGPSL